MRSAARAAGCATGGEGRISLGGTSVDPRWEDLANDLEKGLFLSGSAPCSRERCYYVLRLHEVAALSALMEGDVTTARDIADYLKSRPLSQSEGTRTILHPVSISDQRRRLGFHSSIHQVAQLYIWKGLSELAGQVNTVDARFPADPRKASDQQVAAMAYALYKEYLAHRSYPGQPCALRDPRLPACRRAA